MRKHLVRCILLSALILVAGFGCKGLSQADLQAIQPITVTYWTVFDNVDVLRQFAKDYKAIRPYVTVNVQKIRQDEFEGRFVNALADDVAPDIISVQNTALRQYQSRIAPMPATVSVANIAIKGKYAKEPVVTIETNTMPSVRGVQDNLVSVVGEDVVIGGKLYGLPLAVDTLALYYNKDLLDQAGVPVAPQTWTDFFDAVKQTTKFDDEGNIVQSAVALGTSGNISNAFDILSMLLLQNGVVMSSGGQVVFANGVQQSDNHPTLQTLRFYTDFAQPTKEVYTWNNKQGDAFDAFVRGRSVFYFGFSYDKDRIRARAPQMNVEVLPAPQLNVSSPQNIANYWIQTVVKKTKHPNEAWDFVRFITNAENVKKYVDATGQVSPYRAHIVEQQKSETLGPFANQALFAKNWYRGRNIAATRKAFGDMIDQYVEPYDGPEKARRDANIVINASRVVQQTL